MSSVIKHSCCCAGDLAVGVVDLAGLILAAEALEGVTAVVGEAVLNEMVVTAPAVVNGVAILAYGQDPSFDTLEQPTTETGSGPINFSPSNSVWKSRTTEEFAASAQVPDQFANSENFGF
ncbi:unnamed protein product [Allacma fusca]|uniref:Uncharacterized protein n=1 Tax=Allacma fusca TaxID=39272 RepID=A0A8J2JGD8_9HEXA|nr:unnamed protein product [Allacma fusca]